MNSYIISQAIATLIFAILGAILGTSYRCVKDVEKLRNEIGWLNARHVHPVDNGPALDAILQQNKAILSELKQLRLGAQSTPGYAFLIGANMLLVVVVSFSPASVWSVLVTGTVFNLVMWIHTHNTEPMVLGLLGLCYFSSVLGIDFFKGRKPPVRVSRERQSTEETMFDFDELWEDA